MLAKLARELPAGDGRLRYPARLVRWRPDRDPRSCTFDQFG